MKRTRKGFTLVVLLVTISLVAALSATVLMPVMNGPTAGAKAATIARNVSVITTASTTYYALNRNDPEVVFG